MATHTHTHTRSREIPPVDSAVWRDSSRARRPDESGYVERDGVRVHWQRFGDGEPTLLLLPTFPIVDWRTWRMQVAYLGRHFRVLTFDPRGNGKSDRPDPGAAYAPQEFAADAVAVLDATGTDTAITVSVSAGTLWNLVLCATQPERVSRAVFIGPLYAAGEPFPGWSLADFHTQADSYEDDARYNRNFMVRDYAAFLEWWARKALPEPHSEKGVEDVVGTGLGTDGETIVTFVSGSREAMAAGAEPGWRCIADLIRAGGSDAVRQLASQVRCPVLVVEGTLDTITPMHWAEALADATGGELQVFEEVGHVPHARKPAAFNLALKEFVERDRPPRDPVVHRSSDGRLRALYVSSPIGLGHARRDVAIAAELRRLVPDLQVDWLAQDPVTRVLEREGETIHPASRFLANESAHFECESAEHDLAVFDAWRRADEILLANFMVFHEAASEGHYDLWIGDEAWELDYYLHEHPRLKRAPYAWLTDFVGMLPMPDDSVRGEFVVHDVNEQMVDHVDGRPHVRDASIFVGNPDDLVDARLSPQLPTIREWTERHFDFAGYVTGFDPASLGDRSALRAELGYRPDEKVCVVSVGGSGVGGALLRRVAASFSEASRLVPGLRMILVAGPRIDPASLPSGPGLEVRPYVHDLYKHLAACDLAVVQGGLTTAMELTANGRPFIYFPLEHHFEQRFHVPHRLDRYGAGLRMEFSDSPPEAIALAIAAEIGREVTYAPVETDGARRAATRIAQLL